MVKHLLQPLGESFHGGRSCRHWAGWDDKDKSTAT
jgi:hypothetical protein